MGTYREDIAIHYGSPSEWLKLIEEVKIYELKLPKIYNRFPVGRTESWSKGAPSINRYDRTTEQATILEVVKLWTNPKGTIKVAIVGEDRQFMLFSRNHRADGFLGLNFGGRYSNDPSDVFDNLMVGTWVIAKERYTGSKDFIIGFICNEKKLIDVKTLLDTLYYLYKKNISNKHYKWDGQSKVEGYGTVTLAEVLKQKIIFDRALRRFKWIERKERWDLWNAVKANIVFKKTATKLKVRIQALDGHTYFLECPVVKDEQRTSWKTDSLYKQDNWLPYVYRTPNDGFATLTSNEKMERLVDRHLEVIDKIPQTDFTFGVDNQIVKVERRATKNNARLNFLNGQLVKADSMREKLKKYFILGESIVASPSSVSTKAGTPKKRIMSTQAQNLIDAGLNGTIQDLEGSFPFHLNIIYKAQARKWYIEIAGKEFYVKGGYGALKKVQSAIAGTAIVDHEKYGWRSGNKGTRLVRDRLGELVPDKDALWIILHVKKMGALMKVLTSEK